MKFLYLQDSHIKGINPCNRKGDYYKDIMTKIKEVISLSKKLKVDKIIHGGDLYDSENVSNLMVDELIDAIEKAKIEWYVVPGNHDEVGHDWNNSKGTSLAHIFRRSKLINKLSFLPDTNLKYIIQGFKYYHNCEQDIKEKGLMCETPKISLKIAIVHSMITEKPSMPQIMHIPIKDIKTDFDVIFVAHNHLAWGIKEINGAKFINIGCIGRTGIDEFKIIPQVALIDTETQEIKLIPLKSAKKGEDVFNLEGVKKTKEFNAEIDNFIKSLENSKDLGLDINGIIEYLAKEKNIDKKIKNCVIKRIGELS